MCRSPFRFRLYRIARVAVILASCGLFASLTAPSASSKPRELPPGPRAVAIVQLLKNGKSRLLPIAIYDNGKWYDAQVYRATPVPMAVETGTVYEATQLGESQGLFTITLPQNFAKTWVGKGKWQPHTGDDNSPAKLSAPPTKITPDDRPILRKSGSKPAPTSQPTDSTPSATAPATATAHTSAPPAPDSDTTTNPDDSKAARQERANANTKPSPPLVVNTPTADADTKAGSAARHTSADASTSASPKASDDPDRPVLRRGKPGGKTSDLASEAEIHQAETAGLLQTFPAISAVKNPELRSYKFYFQPGEEATYRDKMLALARQEVLNRARALNLLPPAPGTPTTTSPSRLARRPGSHMVRPADDVVFDSINLRSFDLTYSNEPEFVLAVRAHILRYDTVTIKAPAAAAPSTTTHPPTSASPASLAGPLTYDITLVARADLNGDLHRLLLVATDERHLDQLPRLELIDALDADGDGQGDFLFREINGPETGYILYQTGRDQLWELFHTER